MVETAERVGEVIEAATTEFVAQCYQLYGLPPLGSLVRTSDESVVLYGIVYQATTASLEPGRRPIARGQDESDEAAVYSANPQLGKLLRSEFHSLVVGHKENGKLFHYLPSRPARIHGFVYQCPDDEVREFARSLDFLGILINAHLPVSTEEITAAALRRMSLVFEDRQRFLVNAGKELAGRLGGEFNRLKSILEKLK